MKLSLFAPIDAEAEHAEAMLRNASELAKQAQNTVTWFSLRENAITFPGFGASPNEPGRRDHLERRVSDATDRSGAKPARPCASDRAGGAGPEICGATSAGYVALRPAIHQLDTPHVDTLTIELAFPCVWVAPWSRTSRLEPRQHSLAVNAITTGEELIDDLVNQPTVSNFYSGQHCTYETAPEVPHDDSRLNPNDRNTSPLRAHPHADRILPQRRGSTSRFHHPERTTT
jgi:hypothetical protein